MRVKTTNALMKYLRNAHNISIDGAKDKRNLINIGYYHGYKGYRYINNPQNRITINSFKEIVSIVNFDSKLKSLLYPQLMQIETISKNIVLQILVEQYNTDEFNEIYDRTGQRVHHVMFIDSHFTFWGQGKSYLCRFIDTLNMGLIDELIVGREVLTRWEEVLREYAI